MSYWFGWSVVFIPTHSSRYQQSKIRVQTHTGTVCLFPVLITITMIQSDIFVFQWLSSQNQHKAVVFCKKKIYIFQFTPKHLVQLDLQSPFWKKEKKVPHMWYNLKLNNRNIYCIWWQVTNIYFWMHFVF